MVTKKKGLNSRVENLRVLLKTQSVLLDRLGYAGVLGKGFGTARDYYNVLGYPADLTYKDYLGKYLRDPMANRVVSMPAQATWRNAPGLVEEKETPEETPFEIAWKEINQKLNMTAYMERIDRLSGIGRYGVLLFGVRNSGKLDTPLTEGKARGPEDVVYVKAYTEGTAAIQTFETDPTNARFGRPTMYEIDLAGELTGYASSSLRKQAVHWTRCLHIAEDMMEDEVYGTPRMRPVFNILEDIFKVSGGGAEMFWQGAYRGLHVDVNPDTALGQLGDDDLTDLADEIDEYVNGIRRFIRTQGASVKPIDVELASPKDIAELLLSLLSGGTGIPRRILTGSERGQLASTQDEQNWAAYIRERRDQFAEPSIFRPVVDFLIWVGALPAPAGGYVINWPSLNQLTRIQEAQVAESYARAVRFASGNKASKNDLIVSEAEFRTQFLGLPPKRLDEKGNPIDDTSSSSIEGDEEEDQNEDSQDQE